MLTLSLDSDGPLYRQVYRSLRGAILEARLRAGERLPSSRDLANGTGLSRNTITQAYEQLVAEGYAETRHGSGTFVTEQVPSGLASVVEGSASVSGESSARPRLSQHGKRALRAARPHGFSWDLPRTPGGCDFRYGEPSYIDFPHAVWARLLNRRLRRASARRLSYGPPTGTDELREQIAGYLRRSRGVVCRPEQVLVTRGAQQAIDLAARVLVDPGDSVALEDPHYPGFRMALEAAGAKLLGIEVDGEGLCLDRLAEIDAARLVVVTPSHQFPTGVIMPLARRLELLAWAQRHRAYVLEDDYDSEFRYDGPPIETLQGLDGGRRVIYVGTMSKVLFPALRIGYLVLPEPLVEAFTVTRALADTGSPGIEQLVLADFIREGHFERHIRRSRNRHALRRAALLEAIDAHLGDRVRVCGENAGLHVLLWLEGRLAREVSPLREAASRIGVGVYPVRPCFLRPTRRAGLILGYGSLDERAIRRGIEQLASLV